MSDSDAAKIAEKKFPLTLSVCIPTYNRSEQVKNLIQNILNQTELPDEIVIVDSSSDKKTEEVVINTDKISIPIIYKRYLKGLTLQRNRAVDCAKSALVLFLDDDVELDGMFIREIKECFSADYDNKIAGISGIFTNKKYPDYGIGWKLKQKLGIVDVSDAGRLLSCGETTPLPNREFKGLLRVDFLHGGLTAWRKSIFNKFRYSHFFSGYGLGEDKYFSSCVGKMYDLYICGTAKAKHFHEEGNRPNYFQWGFFNVYNHYFIMAECVTNRYKKIKFILFHMIDAFNDLLTWPFRTKKKNTLLYGMGRIAALLRCLFSPPKMPQDDPAQMNRKTLKDIPPV
jgi:glycosyltransferase involved in cell wall biosynthesis